ncbi:SDR family NAD(P)-dependent oxidoreductase [Actinophytocola sp.]|uniref:SDR family NAD(P)-dependent oxidoreductase n=1 Tax=Actinophytocola sp. TaxID=1872138 RepID=UPI003D6A571C
MRGLDGKRVLILGGGADGPAAGGQGLPMGNGRAVAIRLAEEGAVVAVGDLDLGRAQQTADALATPGVALQADLGVLDDCRRLVAEAEREIGALDIVVANAAITDLRPLRSLDQQSWDRSFAVNVDGHAVVAQAALPGMLERGHGVFVFVSSTAALLSSGVSVSYEASKAAQLALMRHIAVRYASRGVRSNAVVLGVIDSTMVRRVFSASSDSAKARDELGPMQRQGTPEEVGAAAAFLASDDSSYVNGISLVIDGGVSAQWPNPRTQDSGGTDNA